MDTLQYHDAQGRRIAFRHLAGDGPTIVFLPGYKSDMAGGKASAVFDWARANGRACLLLDYSGCGLSDGDFAGVASGSAFRTVNNVQAGSNLPGLLLGPYKGLNPKRILMLLIKGRTRILRRRHLVPNIAI